MTVASLARVDVRIIIVAGVHVVRLPTFPLHVYVLVEK